MPQPINLSDLGGIVIDPIYQLCFLVIFVAPLAFFAQMTQQVNPEIASLLIPPVKVYVKLGIYVRLYPLGH
jgi:hypothetical protein